MKRARFAVGVFVLAFLLVLGTLPTSAEQTDAAQAQNIFDGVLQYKGVDDAQAFIDSELAQNAGEGTVWYALALSQYGDYDFSRYEEAVLSYLNGNTVSAASSRLKYVLCLAAMGSTDAYIISTLNQSVGTQGLMSWVFALHLLNNGYVADNYTADAIREKLFSLQCADGGWSITGVQGDADATAMVLQALAPCYETDKDAKDAADRALAFLSEKQLADGTYVSYGVSNAESTAQVLLALASLSIDAATDARFIKNGNTLLDAMEKFRLSDGSFCHQEGGGTNGTATVQAFCAALAYMRMASGQPPFYLLDRADPLHAERPSEGGESGDTQSRPPLSSEGDTEQTEKHLAGTSYKWWVCLIIVALGGVACAVLVLLKKRNIKNFMAVLLMCALAVTLVCVTNIRSVDEYYGGASEKQDSIGTVTLRIRCDTVAGREEHIPADGVILADTAFPIAKGDTVYTVLADAAKQYRIPLDRKGDAKHAYIAGIAYLYEFDHGDLSGWTFLVNGEPSSVGAGEYLLQDGDVVEWYYTLSLGKDYNQ